MKRFLLQKVRICYAILIPPLLMSCAEVPKGEQAAIGAEARSVEIPSMKDSDESNEDLLRLARKQGDAYQEAMDYMIHQQAKNGVETRAGHYRVGLAVELAEGYYASDGKKLRYQPSEQSAARNCHLEIIVRDGADGRFVPGLRVRATLLDQDGHELGTRDIPFMWHPWLYHYGENWRIPHAGVYTVRVHIDVPEFRRHDERNGARYLKPVDVEFKNVRIATGEK